MENIGLEKLEKEDLTWAELREIIKENTRQMMLSEARMQQDHERRMAEFERKMAEDERRKVAEDERRKEDHERRMAEYDRRKEEHERRMAEYDQRKEDHERRMAEYDQRKADYERRKEENDRLMKETKLQMQETDRKLRELAEQFTSTTGHITEGIMKPAAQRIFQEAGFDISHYLCNMHSKMKNEHAEMEVDLLMLNGTIAIAVEIKTDCRKKDIDHFMRQMAKFKRLFREYRDKEVLAAVAALNYDKDALEYAKKQGLLVITTTDGDLFTLEKFDRARLKRF